MACLRGNTFEAFIDDDFYNERESNTEFIRRPLTYFSSTGFQQVPQSDTTEGGRGPEGTEGPTTGGSGLGSFSMGRG